jgi:hypothetical protein
MRKAHILALASMMLVPCIAFAQSSGSQRRQTVFVPLPGSNFDLFKTPYMDFPDTFGAHSDKNFMVMAPPALDDPILRRQPIVPTWSVPQRSVGIYNVTSVTMHFNANGTEFDLASKGAKTIDLPEGMTALQLVYSIASQRKQVTLAPGRSYVLDLDLAKQEIVSR